jgi:elongation factor G
VKGAILLVDASKGVEVGTERCWEEIRKRNTPKPSSYQKDGQRECKIRTRLNLSMKTRQTCRTFCWPLGHSDSFDGFANVVTKKAHIYKMEKWLKILYSLTKWLKLLLYTMIISEAVAETSEELLEKILL